MYRNLSSLLNELSELGVLISDTQDLLKQVPGDTIVEFQLEQLKHRQSELNKEEMEERIQKLEKWINEARYELSLYEMEEKDE